MPGRRDFGVLMASALGDRRVFAAAALYADLRIARRETAEATVCGHLAMLGVYLSRETDDGAADGDWIGIVRAATMTDARTAARIVSALSSEAVDLLPRTETGHRLRGFAECYEPLIRDRKSARERAARSRERHANGSRDTHRTSREPASGMDLARERGPAQGACLRADAGLPAPPAPAPAPSDASEVTRTVPVTCAATGPDRTGETKTPLPPQAGAEGSSLRSNDGDGDGPACADGPDGAPLTAGERAAAVVIAEAIRSGDLKPDLPPESQPLAEAAEAARAALFVASRASPRDPAAVRAAEDAQRATAAALRDARAAHVAQLVLDLLGGSAAARPVVRRWSASSQLVGKGKDRVMLRVACAAASAQVRAAERDLRRGARDGAA